MLAKFANQSGRLIVESSEPITIDETEGDEHEPLEGQQELPLERKGPTKRDFEDANLAGKKAASRNIDRSKCPYDEDPDLAKTWNQAYDQEKRRQKDSGGTIMDKIGTTGTVVKPDTAR